MGCVLLILVGTTVNMNGLPYALANIIKAVIIIVSLAIQRDRVCKRYSAMTKKHEIINFFRRNIAIPAVLLMFILGATLYGGTFMNYRRNLMNVLLTASMLGIMGLGTNLCFLLGARDLSVSAVGAAASMFSAMFSSYGFLPSLIAGLLCGAVFGIINGVIVAKFKVQPFVATLGTQLAARGVALLVNDELSIEIATDAHALKTLGNGNLFGMIPVPAILFVAMILVLMVVLEYTHFGRSVYAIGGNEEAAAMMGIRVDRTKILVFLMSGLTAGLSALYSADISTLDSLPLYWME